MIRKLFRIVCVCVLLCTGVRAVARPKHTFLCSVSEWEVLNVWDDFFLAALPAELVRLLCSLRCRGEKTSKERSFWSAGKHLMKTLLTFSHTSARTVRAPPSGPGPGITTVLGSLHHGEGGVC